MTRGNLHEIHAIEKQLRSLVRFDVERVFRLPCLRLS